MKTVDKIGRTVKDPQRVTRELALKDSETIRKLGAQGGRKQLPSRGAQRIGGGVVWG